MSHKHSKPEACLNCGYEFKDENNYCPSCGQQNHSLHVPFKHLVLEFLEGTIHLDTKILQTFKFLLFKPGFLTREFNTGKRAAYVPPVRIYIFVSFVFFLLVGLMSGHKSNKEHKSAKEDSKSLVQIGPSDNSESTQKQVDSILASKQVKNSATNHFVWSLVKKKSEEGDKEFSHSALKNISYLMFFLMPLFAFFVFLFNIGKGHYYYEFLIHSIHLHSFLFILFLIFLIVMTFFSSGWFVLAFFLVSVLYFILSMKNAFPQKIFSALWKSFTIVIIYGIIIVIGLIGTLFIS
ncbi:MAG TPA: DUF3667 domain-containing protein [Ignavibacteriales bacterium]|nr:DUF3667 domain-containing protein [Ignavibacteriales bacterium]